MKASDDWMHDAEPASRSNDFGPDYSEVANTTGSADNRHVSQDSGPSAAFEGYLEFFGRHDAAECWVLGGWVSRSWASSTNRQLTATFERGSETALAKAAFYERPGLGERGLGFVILLPTPQRRLGQLLKIHFDHHHKPAPIAFHSGLQEIAPEEIAERGISTLRNCEPGPESASIKALLGRRIVGEGYLDIYGYHSPSTGWFVCGWVSNDWVSLAGESGEVAAVFESGIQTGPAVINYYDRPDIRTMGLGFILHLSVESGSMGRLLQLKLRSGNAVAIARPSTNMEMIGGDRISRHVLDLIVSSDHGPARDALRELAARAAHDGRDTIASLASQILLEVDETVSCPPDSVLLFGWMLARRGAIKALRLRTGALVFPIDIDRDFIWTDRNDVLESLGRDKGFDDPRCGFLARVRTSGPLSGDLYLELETANGEIGFKPLPKPRLEGIPGIKRVLGVVETHYADVDALYDSILGPAVSALNAARLAVPPSVQTMQFGPTVPNPRHSVIVPLYGRIDFMDMQLALFAVLGIGADVEIIYVLDDPPRARETQVKATSLYERFRVPFRLLCLGRNLGFAPANNVGLRASRGRTICFMNSDVFPTTGDWLDRLAAHLDADPTLGVVGPVLLFEDDSVQHQGITFKPLPQFGNWCFPLHKRKGFRPPPHTGLVREHAITGACMLLRRIHAEAYGGFDPSFIIGDFEDTDLCFKLAADGWHAAIDFGVRMHHLERKSQATSANTWRTNLTLYNAWLHQRRWGATIAGLQAAA